MKQLRSDLILLLLLSFIAFTGAAQQKDSDLKVYQAPKGALLNSDFTVKVRQKGEKK